MADPAQKFNENPVPGNEDSAAPGSKKKQKKAASREELAKSESSPQAGQSGETSDSAAEHEDQVGSGYKADNPEELTKMSPSAKGVVKFAKSNRGKIIIGGAAAGFVTLIIVGFFILLPFKILHIVTNLQNRFFATSENAVSNESDQLFSNYMKKYVLPGITNCKGTIDKSCTPKTITGTGLVSQLYRGWSNARLENKLAEKYGIEFSYQKTSGHYFMKTTDTTGNGIDVSGFENSTGNETLDDFLSKSNDPQFKQVSRSDIRQAVKDSFSNETKFKQVFYRFKVGRLLEEKYGIRRCIIACKITDNFSEWKGQKKNAAKAIVAQRILEPRSQMMGTVLLCLLDPNCHPNDIDTSGTCTANIDCEAHGEDVSPEEKTIQSKLDALAAQYGSEDILALYTEMSEKGFTKYAIDQIIGSLIGKFGGDEAAQQAAKDVSTKALPVVGWAQTAFQTIDALHNAGPKLKKLSYIVNSSTMVASFATYRTYADEIKEPSAPKDSTIVGSFVNSLGPGDQNSTNANDKELGGTAGAEQAPLYNKLLSGGDGGSTTYKCNNGNPVPAGKSVCPEEELGGGNAIANDISSFFNQPGIKFISDLASLWDSTAGKLVGWVTGLLGSLLGSIAQYLPGYSSLQDLLEKAVAPLMHAIVQWLIPSPVSSNMSGGRTFDMVAGGADVSGNDYAHNGLGGEELSSQQVSTILQQQQQQQQSQFNQESLYAKIFDTNSNNSLVTKLALAMPSNASGLKSSMASFFTSPFSKLSSDFSTIFSLGKVHAATAGADPFGVTQYGYPATDPIFSTDPENYWTQNCSTDGTTLDMTLPMNKNYHTNVTIDPDTQMPENTTSDPCFLIQAAVGSAGGLFEPTLLTQDEQADLQ